MNIADTKHFLDNIRSNNASVSAVAIGNDRYAQLQRDIKTYLDSAKAKDAGIKNDIGENIEFMGIKIFRHHFLRNNEYVVFDSNGNIVKIAKI